ncbi:MAG: UDP-N-acetylglucosamine diphosphorylase/glucosamine-1-phosphate N-acetyltransferase [Dehalococcoidia bacterium]|nr:UDP-N-acetylglucosamine diphosphorylase/glucosamine-1-phosphate N-acetyltransferase [Dehalococcoidia bacterium]
MRSRLAKPLHHVAGVPMIDLVREALHAAGILDVVVVTAAADDEVARHLRENAPEVRIAVQPEPLGTGHAALAAREAAAGVSKVLIVNADLPLLTAATLRALAMEHEMCGATLTFLTAHLDEATGYGRVVRDYSGSRGVVAVVEERDADQSTRALHEINVGLYALDAVWLWPALEAVDPGPHGERYLTDLVARCIAGGLGVETHASTDAREVQQVNTRVDLAKAEALLRDRVRERLMLEGVTLLDPASTFIDAGVEVGMDTSILPGVHLLGRTRIGSDCRIGPNAVLRDMIVGDDCEISSSTLEESHVGDRVTIGPYCHLRPGAVIEADVHLGNYVEVKASRIGARTSVGHFSYIGDADIGTDVNIGAGTITVNYDGALKHRTRVGDGAFIGSDSLLVAPIEVGAGARTAAGAVVTRNVEAGTLVLGMPARPRTTNGSRQQADEEANGPAGA